jgi:hypothetical protein
MFPESLRVNPEIDAVTPPLMFRIPIWLLPETARLAAPGPLMLMDCTPPGITYLQRAVGGVQRDGLPA